MKYRVGDFVMVKPDIKVGLYGNETGPKECYFNDAMLKYRGFIFEIGSIYSDRYHLKDDRLRANPYCWVDDMLDPVCEPVDLDGFDFNDFGKELFGD